MGRGKQGKKPFRFLWNKSQATAHNVYLLLYPKGPLFRALARDSSLHQLLFDALQSLDTDDFKGDGRVYGGGLFKMEPKELANLPGPAGEPFREVVRCMAQSAEPEKPGPKPDERGTSS